MNRFFFKTGNNRMLSSDISKCIRVYCSNIYSINNNTINFMIFIRTDMISNHTAFYYICCTTLFNSPAFQRLRMYFIKSFISHKIQQLRILIALHTPYCIKIPINKCFPFFQFFIRTSIFFKLLRKLVPFCRLMLRINFNFII